MIVFAATPVRWRFNIRSADFLPSTRLETCPSGVFNIDDFIRRLLALAVWYEETQSSIEGGAILELMIATKVITIEDAFAAFRRAEEIAARIQDSTLPKTIGQHLVKLRANDNAVGGVAPE